MPNLTLTSVQIEALRLAAQDRIDSYKVEHLVAWHELERLGLVHAVETPGGTGLRYWITAAGLRTLRATPPA